MMLKMPAPLAPAPQTIELGTKLAFESLNRDATRPLLLTRDLCTADPSRPRRQNDQAPSRDEQPVDAIAMLTVEHRLVNDLFPQEARAGDVSPKPMIAEQVFTALEVHAQREENVFYPAYETMTARMALNSWRTAAWHMSRARHSGSSCRALTWTRRHARRQGKN